MDPIDLSGSPHGRATGEGAGRPAAFGSDLLLGDQFGRLDPREASLLLDDPAAHAYVLSVIAVLVGIAVELVRLLNDHDSAVVGVDGQPELFRVLNRPDTEVAAPRTSSSP